MLSKERINSANKDKELAEEKLKHKVQELEDIKANELSVKNK